MIDYTPPCPFKKSTLPAKIIHLRKVSQENHVRRMNLAYEKKEMKKLVSYPTCVPPSFPKKSPRKQASVTPTSIQSCPGNIQSRQKSKSDIPGKANCAVNRIKCPDSSKHNSEMKSIKVTKNQNINSGTKHKSSPNLSGNEFCQLHSYDIGEETDKNVLVAKITPSKIPVLKSRLKVNDNLENSNEMIQDYLEPAPNCAENKIENLNPNFEANSTAIVQSGKDLEEVTDCRDMVTKNLPDYPVENEIKELNLQQITGKQDCAAIKVTQSLPTLINQCHEEESCPDPYKTFYEEEKLRDEISLIDEWITGMLDTGAGGENLDESSCTSKFMNTKRINPYENNSMLTQKKDNNEPLNIEKIFGISANDDCITDIKDEESSEIFYEFGEINDDKGSPHLANMDKWQNMSFETDSTITMPSEKDLEVEDYRDPDYRNLPDYPNTPYNLRYPRYNRYNRIFSSIETDSPNTANCRNALKYRNKSYNATPKKLKSDKKKKTKKQVTSKKDLSF